MKFRSNIAVKIDYITGSSLLKKKKKMLKKEQLMKKETNKLNIEKQVLAILSRKATNKENYQ